jgi:putative transposase
MCLKMHCEIVALSGTPDHIHLLVTLPPTLSISDFMESVKGCSSRFLNQAHESQIRTYRWQGSYGVTTVSPQYLEVVKKYVQNQKQHHADSSTWPLAERSSDK